MRVLMLLAICSVVFLVAQCGRGSVTDKPEEETSSQKENYLNLHDSVNYVGIETCRSCHADIYNTFIHTGMGSSFGHADTAKSIANINGKSLLYDPQLDFYYQPFWQDDSLYLREFRLQGPDTVYNHLQKIDYVIGSGQHTNSHLFEVNGFLHQAPFTWYAQKAKLDFPPGFENGHNTRFSRQIGLECTSCHNSMPLGFIKGSVNRYRKVPGAIDCERCHGPGEAHVQRVTSGELVDTASDIDYSIVNVSKLPYELQFEVCQRCHLQGNSVLARGKSFLDFRPGMALREVMDIYLPRYSNAEDEFIMASHVDRFRQSPCVIKSEKEFNCISCHNPHVTVKETRISKFNSTCGNCHKGAPRHECTEEEERLEEENFNCVKCHMPQSTSIDIPHVTVHDHKIDRPEKVVDTSGIKKFLGLVAVNNPKPTDRSKAIAYLQQYERFEAEPYYLDSARYFLDKLNPEESFHQWIYYYFLQGDVGKITASVQTRGIKALLNELNAKAYDNRDGWTAYRIGEAFYAQRQFNTAIEFYERAVELMPDAPDFRNKYSTALSSAGREEEAKAQLKFLLKQYPVHREALNNLGFQYLKSGGYGKAEYYLQRALDQDPDYKLAWLNLAQAYLVQNKRAQALEALQEASRLDPTNLRVKSMIETLKGEQS